MIYPEKIAERLKQLRNKPTGVGKNAIGTEANFTCGSFVRFSLSIDINSNSVEDAAFTSNGCGFMLSAADVLAENVKKRHLIDLHGLHNADLHRQVESDLGEISPERRECVEACINALRAAFADFRAMQIEEFRGEKVLICTCFGVTEETIELNIEERSLQTVEEVAQFCNAGSGCGSCRMLIQEMLDTSQNHLRRGWF